MVDLDYTSTSLGFRNSGALSAGRLFLWDTKAEKLVTLDAAIPLESTLAAAPVDLRATSVRGALVSSSVKISSHTTAEIEAEVRNNLFFEVEGAVRVNNIGTYSAISDAYRELLGEGVNAYSAWRIESLTRDPDRFKLVLLVDEVRASREEIVIDRGGASGAFLTIVDEFAGEVKVAVPASTSASCSGKMATCYVSARALSVHLTDDGNLDYSPSTYEPDELVRALRGI